jgi:hypothetical protein
VLGSGVPKISKFHANSKYTKNAGNLKKKFPSKVTRTQKTLRHCHYLRLGVPKILLQKLNEIIVQKI